MRLKVREFNHEGFKLPPEVTDLTSFRRWVLNPEFPKTPRYGFFDDEIWVDGRHDSVAINQARLAVSIAIAHAEDERIGHFVTSGMRLTHLTRGVSFEPEGMFWTYDWQRQGRIRYGFGPDEVGDEDVNDACEIIGTPEILLSVMPVPGFSNRRLFEAMMVWIGCSEWWRVDLSDLRTPLKILRWGHKGFSARPEADGFFFSHVLKKHFRLRIKEGPLGHPKFHVEQR